MPRTVIALPVYNGALLLEDTLRDLQAQTAKDMAVVIYDNASTDATPEIANRFAEADKRFSVITRPATVPLFDNFLMTLDDSDCAYFGWRAYDDLSAPNYVECLTQALVERPSAAFAGSEIRTHKVHKNRWVNRKAPEIKSQTAAGISRLIVGSYASWIYGVFRRPHLDIWYRRALASLPHTWAVDHATLYPMIVRGQCVTTNDTYFIQKIGADPAKKSMASLPTAQQFDIYKSFYNYCSAQVDETSFSAPEKAMIKSATAYYASKRTFRVTRMARQKLVETLRGKQTIAQP